MCAISGRPCCSFSPITPGAAVHLEQHRRLLELVLAGRQVEVEQPSPAGLAVGQVLDHPHRVVAEVERSREAAPGSGQVCRGGGRVQLGDVLHAQALDEGVLEVVLGALLLADQLAHAECAQASQREAEPAAPARLEVTGRVERGERQHLGGQLAEDPPGAEGREPGSGPLRRTQGVGSEGGDDALAQEEAHPAKLPCGRSVPVTVWSSTQVGGQEVEDGVDAFLPPVLGHGGVAHPLELHADEGVAELTRERVEALARERVLAEPQAEHLLAGRAPALDDLEVGGGEVEVPRPLRPERRAACSAGTAPGPSTGASTIIARAKPPVKHMPSAPTPGPPSSSCSSLASERSQPATGEVTPVRSLVNSRLTHTWRSALAMVSGVMPAPSRPNRLGITTV